MELNKNNIKYDPKLINTSKVLITNSFSDWVFENTFIIFKSFNEFLILTYATEQKSIIFYNLKHFQIISEIKEAHKEYITNFAHCYDKNLKMDLIMSVSKSDNNIKIWNLTNNNCILNLTKINKDGILNSACFLNYEKNNYIITSNRNWVDPEPLKIYNLKGEKIKQISCSKRNTFFIDTYYENKNKNKNTYIITGNEGNVISYNYEENELYKIYCEQFENDVFHHCVKIYEDNKESYHIIKLIESSDGINSFIRIWDFHSSQLLGKIESSNNILRSIGIWDSNFAFAGCGDKSIKLINLESCKIINSLVGHQNNICTIKIIFHPQLGKCIISQGHNNDQIRIWTLTK